MGKIKQLLEHFGRWLVLTFSVYQVEDKYKPMATAIRAVKLDATVYVAEIGEINYATPVQYSKAGMVYRASQALSLPTMSSAYLTNVNNLTACFNSQQTWVQSN
jgi:hypothetical protein